MRALSSHRETRQFNGVLPFAQNLPALTAFQPGDIVSLTISMLSRLAPPIGTTGKSQTLALSQRSYLYLLRYILPISLWQYLSSSERELTFIFV